MAGRVEKPPKIGTEITVRISLTFQEAPDVHTLLAMTPVRERGKLVRLALERYITETGHPAGDVEQQIDAISTWLRFRNVRAETIVGIANQPEADCAIGAGGAGGAGGALQFPGVPTSLHTHSDPAPAESISRSDSSSEEVDVSSSSINRWLQA